MRAARIVKLSLGHSSHHQPLPSANRLLVAAALVLLTNVVTFALLYWQLDGGGPAGRFAQQRGPHNFRFPQTPDADAGTSTWRPHFGDHLYLAYTNVVAFSPTDSVPLTLRAKGLMTLQSLISLGVLVVVLSRVINVLPE